MKNVLTLLEADETLHHIFSDLIKEDLNLLTLFVKRCMDQCNVGQDQVVLGGISQDGLIAHPLATRMQQSISHLQMGITCPLSMMRFRADNIPTKISWLNVEGDPLFPGKLCRKIITSQGSESQERYNFTAQPGDSHSLPKEYVHFFFREFLNTESTSTRTSTAPDPGINTVVVTINTSGAQPEGLPSDWTPAEYLKANSGLSNLFGWREKSPKEIL